MADSFPHAHTQVIVYESGIDDEIVLSGLKHGHFDGLCSPLNVLHHRRCFAMVSEGTDAAHVVSLQLLFDCTAIEEKDQEDHNTLVLKRVEVQCSVHLGRKVARPQTIQRVRFLI